jgi:multicomponent Na+:H+ antiporter subunit B
MTHRARLIVFAVGAMGVGAALAWGIAGAPDFGHYRGPYGNVLLPRAVPERHATNVVNSVTFDYRGIDTIGEEFILFAAVMGVTLLLRRERDEDEWRGVGGGDRPLSPTGDAVRISALTLLAPALVLAVYVVAHGHLTPGGGFQGGMILGAAPLLVYLAGRAMLRRSTDPMGPLELGEGTGAGGFVAIGIVGLVATGAFLQNVWPLGQVGSISSGGTLLPINLMVGIEVGAGIVIVLYEFLQQTLLRGRR